MKILGVSKEEQVYLNCKADELDDLEKMEKVTEIYNKYIRESVHNNW